MQRIIRGFASDLPSFQDCGRPLRPEFDSTPMDRKIDAELDLQQLVLSRTNCQAEPATFLQRKRANREVDSIFKGDLHCVNPKSRGSAHLQLRWGRLLC